MLIKKPWCLRTNDLNMIKQFDQFQCSGQHEHEPAEGGNAAGTAFYTISMVQAITECWYPQKFHAHTPVVSTTAHAFVTKNLSKSEWLKDPRGVQAVQKEAEGLRSNGTWSDESVILLHELKQKAKTCRTPICIASLLTLCGIKHWEQPAECHKVKGRIVYRGDLIRNESDELVLFADTATTPTALVALNIALFYGCMKDCAISCADAIQAFLQAPLEDETWVVLPEELWLCSWHQRFAKGSKLAVRLLKSLYGHPLAGRLWQEHLATRLAALGGVELEQYPSNWVFRRGPNDEHTLLLNAYVDDLTLSGPIWLHEEFWADLRKAVKLEPETFIGHEGTRILGRTHNVVRGPSKTQLCLDMRSYAEQIVVFYCEMTGMERQKLKKVASPALPESSMGDDELEEGELHHLAARILMRLLWLSRLSRPDLAFIVGRLASRVTRWTRWEDRQLMRAISYLNSTIEHVCVGEISHEHPVEVVAYTDADFASCPFTAKSTSGVLIAIKTGECVFPVLWYSKKQSSVARSTPEAEMIAFASAMFGESLHVQDMLQHLLGARVTLRFAQDNEAVIKIIQNKYSAKLRHCNRVHRVNIASICATLDEDESVLLEYCQTNLQLANPLTKIIPPASWQEALQQLQVRDHPVPQNR